MNNAEFNQALIANGYICDSKFSLKILLALANKPVAGAFLYGQAGVGKTYATEIVAKILQADYLYYQCFAGTREDDLFCKILPCEDTISGTKVYDSVIIQAIKILKNTTKKVVLTFDEWDKSRPSTDVVLLDLLQSGRVNYNNYHYLLTAEELSRLYVFVAMNEERELSEKLARRLPKIDFQPFSQDLIRKALEITHKGNKNIDNVLILYTRCLQAGMSKPATIQELRQLLNAIELAGEEADWNSLVYQFVTKTEENHELLKNAERYKIKQLISTQAVELDTTKYEEQEEKEEKLELKKIEENSIPKMPRMIEIKKFSKIEKEELQKETSIEQLEKSSGVLVNNDKNYNLITKEIDIPSNDAKNLKIAKVEGDAIIINKPILLKDWYKYIEYFDSENENGEIVFITTESNFSLQDIKELQQDGLIISYYTKEEIIAYFDKYINIRFTKENNSNKYSAEVICKLSRKSFVEGFAKLFLPSVYRFKNKSNSCSDMLDKMSTQRLQFKPQTNDEQDIAIILGCIIETFSQDKDLIEYYWNCNDKNNRTINVLNNIPKIGKLGNYYLSEKEKKEVMVREKKEVKEIEEKKEQERKQKELEEKEYQERKSREREQEKEEEEVREKRKKEMKEKLEKFQNNDFSIFSENVKEYIEKNKIDFRQNKHTIFLSEICDKSLIEFFNITEQKLQLNIEKIRTFQNLEGMQVRCDFDIFLHDAKENAKKYNHKLNAINISYTNMKDNKGIEIEKIIKREAIIIDNLCCNEEKVKIYDSYMQTQMDANTNKKVIYFLYFIAIDEIIKEYERLRKINIKMLNLEEK